MSEVMTKLRRFYWQRIRRYRYEICQDCGRPVSLRAFGLTYDASDDEPGLSPSTYWFADNHVWNSIMATTVGILCPHDFMKRAMAAGIHVGWRCGLVGDIEIGTVPSNYEQAVVLWGDNPARWPKWVCSCGQHHACWSLNCERCGRDRIITRGVL